MLNTKNFNFCGHTVKAYQTNDFSLVNFLTDNSYIIINQDKKTNTYLLAPDNLSPKMYYTITKKYYPCEYVVNLMLNFEYCSFGWLV